MRERIVTSPTAARAGSQERVVRYTLAISLSLVVISFVLSYLVS